jgi:hypothetical protein
MTALAHLVLAHLVQQLTELAAELDGYDYVEDLDLDELTTRLRLLCAEAVAADVAVERDWDAPLEVNR